MNDLDILLEMLLVDVSDTNLLIGAACCLGLSLIIWVWPTKDKENDSDTSDLSAHEVLEMLAKIGGR